jgi:prolyl-tRNA synthetase
MAAAIEAAHDDDGIIWPLNIAPYSVAVVALDVREPDVMATAERIHDELEAQGIDVLLDDRDARPGFKFKDADLIGIPLRLTIGKRGLGEGIVEFKRRSGGEIEKIPTAQAVAHIARVVEQKKR